MRHNVIFIVLLITLCTLVFVAGRRSVQNPFIFSRVEKNVSAASSASGFNSFDNYSEVIIKNPSGNGIKKVFIYQNGNLIPE